MELTDFEKLLEANKRKEFQGMTDLFTESDCDVSSPSYLAISLDKANLLLREKGKIVFGHETGTCIKWYLDEVVDASVGAKHQAILMNIRPIEAPDTAEKVLEDFLESTWTYKSLQEMADRIRKLLGKD